MKDVQPEFDFSARPKPEPPPAPQVSEERLAALREKIKKLLRVGADKRGNAHEAERAMALAFELAEQHRIDVTSLDLEEETAKIVYEYFHIGERLDTLRMGVINVLQSFFHVTVCISSPRLLVIGKPEDIMVANYVHDFLVRVGRECLRAYIAREKAAHRRITTMKRAGYLQGFIYGVANQLTRSRKALALDDSRTALVTAEEAARKRKLDDIVPPKSRGTKEAPKARHNQTALEHGWHDGRATQINQPLTGNTRATLALL